VENQKTIQYNNTLLNEDQILKIIKRHMHHMVMWCWLWNI